MIIALCQRQHITSPYISMGMCRADSRLEPSQWETSLQSNTVSHWLGANLESALDVTTFLVIDTVQLLPEFSWNTILLQVPYTLQWCEMNCKVSQITCTWLCVQLIVQANSKENIKALYYWPFVIWIHQWLVDPHHKEPVMWKTFACHDVNMMWNVLDRICHLLWCHYIFTRWSLNKCCD